MLGLWELKIRNTFKRTIKMKLDGILSNLGNKTVRFTLNDRFNTIRYIEKEEYTTDVYEYIEPGFTLRQDCGETPRFIVFSAPGATGKTALAKFISYSQKGVYWDLPDNKVAEYSLQGALQKAVGMENISAFSTSLNNGDEFLVIDGFDEAEAGSGRAGIEFFLRDLHDVVHASNYTSAVLLARTESALFVIDYLAKNNIPFAYYEVGYFDEISAKKYVEQCLQHLGIKYTKIVEQCVNTQFSQIREILTKKEADSFLGYAPVLNALAVAYDDEKNTLNLLKKVTNTENSCQLLMSILMDLLKREQQKFLKALSVKLPTFSGCQLNVYNEKEQLLRIFGKLAYGDASLFISGIDNIIPVEHQEEYLEVINTQLAQHPFIRTTKIDETTICSFAGIAFQDFVISYCLACEDSREFAREYVDGLNKYCPSQLLVEFYHIFSERKIEGKDIPLFYNSFCAHAQFSDTVLMHISGDTEDCSVKFILERNSIEVLSFEFSVDDLPKGLYVDQLSNCYIDVDGVVYVGNSKNEARIYNSIVNCRRLVWVSDRVALEAYSPGECSIITDSMEYNSAKMPKFSIKTDDLQRLSVYCPSISGYFRLLPYHRQDNAEENESDFIVFANLIRRILSCMRSHSKDAMARKIEFIDNRIISNNAYKKQILKFLLESEILYTDEQDWLYKLGIRHLADYSMKWQEVRNGDFSSLTNLYSKFGAWRDNGSL